MEKPKLRPRCNSPPITLAPADSDVPDATLETVNELRESGIANFGEG